MENNEGGFMKKIMVLSIIVIMGIAISCASRRSEVIKGRPFIAANERIAHGEKVFMMYCEKCHPGGEAGLGPSINANPAPQLIKRFQVRHGLGVMPSFKKDQISKSDVHDISRYLHAWKKY
jgi:mono/diheme cytochrome c family protein